MATTFPDRLTLRMVRLVPHLLILAALIGLWELAVINKWINDFLIPRPSGVFRAFVKLYVTQQTIYWHLFVTMFETVVGFGIGASVGIGLAVASALNDTFRRYVAPYAIVLNVTPGLALTPIIIAWFGFDWGSKIALAAVICFFPIFVNILSGLTQQKEEDLELFASLGSSRVQRFWKLQVPSALPLGFAGMKIGMTTALIGAVVAEFAQATEGLGVLMQRFSFRLDMASAVTVLLTMSMMGLVLYSLMELLDDRMVFWRRESGMARVGDKRRKAFRRVSQSPKNNHVREDGLK